MNALCESITAVLGAEARIMGEVGGGCIHDARQVKLADGRVLFVKSARGAKAGLLAAESRGLDILCPHIRVPRRVGEATTADGTRWLALEWLDLRAMGERPHGDLGRQLARLHAVTSASYGLDHDNYIGATPQMNRPAGSWSAFYQECRLRPQLAWARGAGHQVPEKGVLAAAAALLKDHQPAPTLLHGDLWSGNMAALADGQAVVFDPAPYFGDAEVDLAMMELFGGPLPRAFHAAYGACAPGRERRRPLYDLYHALNHLNLFGSGYASMVRRCLTALGVVP